MKKNYLRFLSIVLSAFLLVLSFSACKKDNGNNAEGSTGSSKPGQTSAKTTAKPSSTGTKTGNAASGTLESQGGGGSQSGAGNNSYQSDQPGSGANQPGDEGGGVVVDTDIISTGENKIDLGGRTLVINDQWVSNAANNDILSKGMTKFYDAQMGSIEEAEKKYNCKITYGKLTGAVDAATIFLQNAMAGTANPFDAMIHGYNQVFARGWVGTGNDIVEPLDAYLNYDSPAFIKYSMQNYGLFKGKHWIFPAPVTILGETSLAVQYNRSILDRYGIEDFQDIEAKGQWTWDTFLDICLKLTNDINGDGIIDQYALEVYYYDLANALICSNGGNFFEEGANGKFNLLLTDNKAIQALTFAVSLSTINKVTNPNSLFTKQFKSFRAGESAMIIEYPYQLKYHDDNGLSDDVGLVAMPVGPQLQAGSRRSLVDSGRAVIFSSALKDKENVIPVICDVMSVWDERKSYYANGGEYPGSWEVMRRPQDDNVSQRDIKYMDELIIYNPDREYSILPYLPDFQNTFKNEVKKAFDEKITLTSAIESIRSPLQAILDSVNLR